MCLGDDSNGVCTLGGVGVYVCPRDMFFAVITCIMVAFLTKKINKSIWMSFLT